MKKGALGILVGLLALALAMGGCGGSEDSTAATLTKAEFLKQGNKICLQGEEKRNEAMREAAKGFKPGRTKAEQDENLEEMIAAAVPPFRETAEELGELPPPKGEEERVETIVESMEESADNAEAEPLEASDNHLFEKSQDLLREYGLVCLN